MAGEELGTEQSAAAVYEELCRILFGSVLKKPSQSLLTSLGPVSILGEQHNSIMP